MNIDKIKLVEEERKRLDILKLELENNKPFKFQKKEFKKYEENIKLIDKKIEEYDNILLHEYENLE